MILVPIFDKTQIWERGKIPNSLRGSLSCLGFRGSQERNAIKYDMHGWPMYNIPNWKFGMLQIIHANVYDQDQGLTGTYHNTTLQIK